MYSQFGVLSFCYSIPQVTYTPITMHASYPDYVAMFDQLTNDCIICTLYTPARIRFPNY